MTLTYNDTPCTFDEMVKRAEKFRKDVEKLKKEFNKKQNIEKSTHE